MNVIIDRWYLKPGQDKYVFMEENILSDYIDYVLVVCSSNYTKKANARNGGVGDETQIMSTELYKKTKQTKFIPVVIEKDDYGEAYVPNYLKSRIFIDGTSEQFFEEIVNYLWGIDDEPPLIGQRWKGDTPYVFLPPDRRVPVTQKLVETFNQQTISMFNLQREVFRFSLYELTNFQKGGLSDELISRLDIALRATRQAIFNDYSDNGSPEIRILVRVFDGIDKYNCLVVDGDCLSENIKPIKYDCSLIELAHSHNRPVIKSIWPEYHSPSSDDTIFKDFLVIASSTLNYNKLPLYALEICVKRKDHKDKLLAICALGLDRILERLFEAVLQPFAKQKDSLIEELIANNLINRTENTSV